MPLSKLPIDGILPDLLGKLRGQNCLVLQASPGTGKTTRVPPALLDADFIPGNSEILVLEPRRLAAKWAARRVAEERGEAVGKTVGYQFRFENVTSPGTRLRFLTEGMLMRRLVGDPELKRVSAVILDEFHERHLHGDIALAYLRWLQLKKRPDLKIVVMSATLDTQSIATFLGESPVLDIEARQFPVEVEYLPGPPAKHLDALVTAAVISTRERDTKDGGDILVFLPGMGEIRRCTQALESSRVGASLQIVALHGELSREEQDLAIQRASRRKVILSTNVAETSLTIEGVTTVIDSGLHRQASYSWWSGVPALKTRPISRASAIQRAGRAGRTAPGRCLRLYTRGDFDSRPPFDTPEIRRADICQTYLELKVLGVREPERFEWFEAPALSSLEAARRLLYYLGALESVESGSALTEQGRRMSQIAAHPRMSRLLIEADRHGNLQTAATLATMIGEGRIENTDALIQFGQLAHADRDPGLARARNHLLNSFGAAQKQTPSKPELLGQAVLAGFPDRVALKRPGTDPLATHIDLLLSSGGSARIENSGAIREHECFVTLEIQEKQHQSQTRSQLEVRALCPIQSEWLFDLQPTLLTENDVLEWDSKRQRVVAFSRLTYDQLVLTQSESVPDPEKAVSVLLRSGLGIDPSRISGLTAQEWTQALSAVADPEVLESALARLSLFAQLGELSSVVLSALQGKLSLAELRDADWTDLLLGGLSPSEKARLDRTLPLFLQLPSGKRTKIHYSLAKPPWVESRLQDFFGMRQGPTLLDGRLPLTLHLLAPNYRAVQVTQDLAGFWQRAYPEVRKELSRRYPRHKWPEDPLKA